MGKYLYYSYYRFISEMGSGLICFGERCWGLFLHICVWRRASYLLHLVQGGSVDISFPLI